MTTNFFNRQDNSDESSGFSTGGCDVLALLILLSHVCGCAPSDVAFEIFS